MVYSRPYPLRMQREMQTVEVAGDQQFGPTEDGEPVMAKVPVRARVHTTPATDELIQQVTLKQRLRTGVGSDICPKDVILYAALTVATDHLEELNARIDELIEERRK